MKTITAMILMLAGAMPLSAQFDLPLFSPGNAVASFDIPAVPRPVAYSAPSSRGGSSGAWNSVKMQAVAALQRAGRTGEAARLSATAVVVDYNYYLCQSNRRAAMWTEAGRIVVCQPAERASAKTKLFYVIHESYHLSNDNNECAADRLAMSVLGESKTRSAYQCGY